MSVSYTCSHYPFPTRHILDSSKLKEFEDDNSKFNENGTRVFQKGRKHCAKRKD